MSKKEVVKTIIGIDPGKSGGLAIYSSFMQKPQVVKMPKTPVLLKEVLSNYVDTNLVVYIEKVSRWRGDEQTGGKAFGIDKMLANYTELLTVMQLLSITYIEVLPRTWRKALNLPKINVYKQRKDSNKKHAQYLFPAIKATLWNCDCLLILNYAFILEIGQIRPVPKKTTDKLTLF